MTERVVSQSGKTVEVATLADVSGEAADIPVATSTSTGVVKGGGNVVVSTDGSMSVTQVATGNTLGLVKIGSGIGITSTGEISTAAATTTTNGGVKVGAAVTNVGTQSFTDIAGAQTSVNAVATQLNALLAALRTSGVIPNS